VTVKAKAYKSGSTASAVSTAAFTIQVDNTPPTVSNVTASGDPRKVIVSFSEPLNKASAENPANYGINGMSVTGAALGTDNTTVVLALGADLLESTSYILTVNNVRDLNNNTIAANSQTPFEFTAITVTEGLVAYWDLNENTGITANDVSGNGHTGTISSAGWVSGESGSALDFPGGAHVDVGKLDITGGTGFTAAMWVNVDAFTVSDARIISKSTSSAEQDHYWMLSTYSGSKLRFRIKAGGATSTLVASSGTMDTDKWYHAAVTYDGAAMKIYLDGAEVGSMGKTGTVGVNPAVSAWIGNNPGNPSQGFNGIIDEVRLYNRALSPSEIDQLYSGSGSTRIERATGQAGIIQVYPNPFNPTVNITVGRWPLVNGSLKLNVYDINGHHVKKLTANRKKPSVTWNASNHASGIYILKVSGNGTVRTKQLYLIK
jgi:hypothetical protein